MRVFNSGKGLIKAWIDGVPVDQNTIDQAQNIADLPFIFKHLALMPDCHGGIGATIGSVVPTKGAVIPAAVGVDIGCGMVSRHYEIPAGSIKELAAIRAAIEAAIPHGRTNNGQEGDIGAWSDAIPEPENVRRVWNDDLWREYFDIWGVDKDIQHPKALDQLGTLGTGNHFIELQRGADGDLWITIHSGSRGPGAKIGNVYIKKAKELMEKFFITLPDRNLAYLPENEELFCWYWAGVQWAQKYAGANRLLMLELVEKAMADYLAGVPIVQTVHCNHNYVRRENHFGQNIFVTRKGAISAREDEWGIIPGSMGAYTYIVQGRGNRESFCSASHGAGRAMSRTEAKKNARLKIMPWRLLGVECDKTSQVLDETPAAYKDIGLVMQAQADLVGIKEILTPLLVVKGLEEEKTR